MGLFAIALCLLLGIASAQCTTGWAKLPNQLSVFNVTSINWQTSYAGYPYNATYAYIPTNGLYSGLWQSMIISAYNSTSFVGNVTFMPFHSGVLVGNRTINGAAYSCLSVWYQPALILTNSRYYSAESAAIKSIVQINNSYDNLAQIQLYNASILNSVTSFVTGGASYATKTTINFNLKNGIPYYFLSNTGADNFSLSFYPSIFGKYQLTQIGTTVNITAPDTFFSTSKTGTAASSANSTINLNNPYSIFASNNLILYSNGTIRNNTGYSSSLGGLFLSSSEYSLIVYAPNAIAFSGYPLAKYYLIPAYSSDVVTTGGTLVINPVIQPQTYSFSWRYSENISNINWTTEFTTLANYSHPNRAQIILIKTPYLMLNLTHYTQYGSCAHPPQLELIAQLSNVTIPYAVHSCTNSTLSLIVSNTTIAPYYTYNALRIYFNSSFIGFESGAGYNQSLNGAFSHNYTGSGVAAATDYVLGDNPMFVKFFQPMTINQSLIDEGRWQAGVYGTASGYPIIQNYGRVTLNDIFQDTLFYESSTYIYGYGLSFDYTNYGACSVYYGYCPFMANTTTSEAGYYVSGPQHIKLNYNSKAMTFYPYTQSYTSGNIIILNNSVSCSTCGKSPSLPPIPNGGSSPLNNWLNDSNLTNATARTHALGLNKSVSLYGQPLNIVEIVVFVIMVIIVALAVFSDDHIGIIVTFILLWIIILGSFNLGEIALGMIITAVVFIYEILPHKKGG